MARMTAKQQRFVEEYLIDLNATQAAIRAGYSVKNADKIGSQLLGKTRVSEAVSRAKADRSRRTGINADRVLQELAKIGFVNIADLTDFLQGTDRGKRHDTAAVQSLKVKTIPTEEGEIVEREIRLNDKLKALELLGKHVDLFTDRLKLEGSFGVTFSGENELE